VSIKVAKCIGYIWINRDVLECLVRLEFEEAAEFIQ
jgi:hypothetical protein